jgi:hypothetical protein
MLRPLESLSFKLLIPKTIAIIPNINPIIGINSDKIPKNEPPHRRAVGYQLR